MDHIRQRLNNHRSTNESDIVRQDIEESINWGERNNIDNRRDSLDKAILIPKRIEDQEIEDETHHSSKKASKMT